MFSIVFRLLRGEQDMRPHPNLPSGFISVITALTGYSQLLLAVLMRLYGYNSVIWDIADIQEPNWPIVHAHLENLVAGLDGTRAFKGLRRPMFRIHSTVSTPMGLCSTVCRNCICSRVVFAEIVS